MPSEKLLTHPSESKRINHLPALDGARGLAVLLVLLDHASDAEMQLFPGADLNRLGKYGVYLFFVLSAFLLTYQFYVRRREEFMDRATWINYASRRFLRIFPLYIVVLLAYTAMERLTWDDFLPHLFLREGERAFWTIPVEVKFYLLLPFIALALFWAGRKHWLLGVAGGFIAAGAGAALLTLERSWSIQKDVLLAPNLAPFLLGAGAAILYGTLQKKQAGGLWRTCLECAGIAAFLGILLRIPSVFAFVFPSDDPAGKFENDPAVCGVLWSVFILGALYGNGWLARVLQWGWLRYLGLISFSAYLWHGKFLSDVDDLPLPPVLRLLVFLILVVAVATASYFLLERPLLRLRPRRTAAAEPIVIAKPVAPAAA